MSARFTIWSALAVLAIPAITFLITGLAAGMGVPGTIAAFAEQCSQHRQNPLVVGLLGAAPLILLWIAVRVVRRNPAISPSAAAWGGLVPIVVVLAWASFQFWPKFLPSRVYPGFPHGLEFVLGPLVFAPIGMVLGLVVATVATRRSAP